MDDVDRDTSSAPGSAGILARLAAKEEARRAERAQRAQAAAALSDPREDVTAYLEAFNAQHAELAAAVASAAAAAAAIGGTGAIAAQPQQPGALPAAPRSAAEVGAALEAALRRVAELEKATADAAYYLPSYDLKRAGAALAEVRAAAEAARAAMAPRRKFAFSSKRAAAVATPAAPAASGGSDAIPSTQQQQQQQQQHGTNQQQQHATNQQQQVASANQQPQQDSALSPYDRELIAAGHGAAGLTGATIVRTAAQLAGREFVLSDLTDCCVWLLGEMPALRLARLTRCRVYAGPVRGAAFVNGAEGCTLALASHQVRLHSMSDTDVYLRVRSRPVIEHCRGLRFAPLTDADLSTLGIAAAAADAGLGAGPSPAIVDAVAAAAVSAQQNAGAVEAHGSTGEEVSAAAAMAPGTEPGVFCDLWRAVDDFGWVKATHSPNWGVMAEGDRQPAEAPPGR